MSRYEPVAAYDKVDGEYPPTHPLRAPLVPRQSSTSGSIFAAERIPRPETFVRMRYTDSNVNLTFPSISDPFLPPDLGRHFGCHWNGLLGCGGRGGRVPIPKESG